MARPKCCRRVGSPPGWFHFKPQGIPISQIEEIALSLDEFESVRLADYEGLYQKEAADMMNVSRQTFGRIVESAHQKIAEALVQGKLLKVEGGIIEVTERIRKQKKLCHRRRKGYRD